MKSGSGRKRNTQTQARRRTHPWIAMGAVGLAACGVAGGPLANTVHAGGPEENPTAAELAQSAAIVHFEIEGGALADVVGAFERATGLRITFNRPGIDVLGSPGVKGDLTPERAMARLLEGTGVAYRYVASNVIALDLRAASSAVTVNAEDQTPTPSSAKYPQALREVPQTIEIIPRAVMEQQGAITLSDALRNVPGITLQAGEGGGASSTTGDMFNLRGFNASNSLFVDGVRDDGLMSRNVFNLEQVEVFLGPTGSDVGRGTASGYVNMQTKTPGPRSAYSGTLGYDSGDQKRGSIDLNQPIQTGISGWFNRISVRLNALWQQGGVPGRDIVKLKNRSIAPSVAFGLNSRTRVTFSSQVTRQRNMPDYGVPGAAWPGTALTPTTVKASLPVSLSNYYGSIDYDYDKISQNNYTLRGEHDLNDGLTLRQQFRYNSTHRDAVVTGIGGFTAATQTVALQRQGNDRENRIASSQTSVSARLSTGKLLHNLSGGFEYTYEDQFAPTIGGVGTRAAADIYNPNPRDPVTGFAPAPTGAVSKGWTHTEALYAFDSIAIGKLQISGGLRWEHFTTQFRALGATGVATTDQQASDALTGGKAGVLYHITDNGTAYFSYGTSATPPGTANFTLSAQGNNQNNPNVKPQESRNYEIGNKWDFFRSRLALSGSAFRTINRNVIFTVDAAAVPPVFNQDDGQEVKGLSFSANGQVTSKLRVLMTLGYLHPELQTQNSTNNGKMLILTPPFSGSLWATYLLPHKITVGGGVRHTDKVWVNSANTIQVPATNIADAVVEYPVNSNLSLRMNVYNLTDSVYVRSVNNNGNRYNPGAPRTFMVTAVFRQ